MDKTRKSANTRKPPEPAKSHEPIAEWMSRVMPDLNPVMQSLDELIRATIPDLDYAVKWRKAYYGLPEQGWIIEMVAYDVSVNVVFLGGADFDDPPPLGSNGRSRYIKIKDVPETRTPEMKQWIEQAGRVPGWQ